MTSAILERMGTITALAITEKPKGLRIWLVPSIDHPFFARFQTLTDLAVQFVGASATAEPCFRAWIVRQSNRLVRNRHVIGEFVPQQRVSIMKDGGSVVRHAVTTFPTLAATIGSWNRPCRAPRAENRIRTLQADRQHSAPNVDRRWSAMIEPEGVRLKRGGSGRARTPHGEERHRDQSHRARLLISTFPTINAETAERAEIV